MSHLPHARDVRAFKKRFSWENIRAGISHSFQHSQQLHLSFTSMCSWWYLENKNKENFPAFFAISRTITHHSNLLYNLALTTEKTSPCLAKMECSQFYQLDIYVQIKSVKLDRMSGLAGFCWMVKFWAKPHNLGNIAIFFFQIRTLQRE